MIVRSPKWIAELRVVFVHPDGRRVPGHIAVGEPYVLGGGDPADNYESHCPVEIDSLYPPGHPAIGGGTLSALLGAVKLLAAMLHAFTEQGGRVLDAEDGSDVPLEALFGPLLFKIEPPANDASQ
jgi:hypothetical protein